MSDSSSVVVRVMLGVRQIDLALKCLGSFQTFCRHPFDFVVHGDGSLDEAARQRLEEPLRIRRIHDRNDSAEEVHEWLAKHPRCRHFRDTNLFGLKLFDAPLLTPAGQRVVYLDTDILFTRPFLCPDFFVGGSFPFTAMQDLKESYAVPIKLWPTLHRLRIQFASRICAGMISYDRAAYDLDYIEWLLKMDEEVGLFASFPFWAEQSMYAALANRQGCGWVEPDECVVAHRANITQARRATIIHFAGFSRHYFPEVCAGLDFASTAEPRVLNTCPTPPCNLWRRLRSAYRTRFVLWEDPAHKGKK